MAADTDQWRNDLEGDIGICFRVEVSFAMTALGRNTGGGICTDAAELALWSAEDQERLATVRVGPSSSVRGCCAFEVLQPHIVVHAGKEYRLTQRCTKGMPDAWWNGCATTAEVVAQTRSHLATFVGGVYNFTKGYPSFQDPKLRRAGMVNFLIAPSIAAFDLDEQAVSVRELKRQLEEKTGVAALQQRISDGTKVLEDELSLEEAGVSEGAYLFCTVQAGAYIATASADGTACLWNLSSGKRVQSYSGHTGGVLCVDFSPSFDQLVTASADGTARLWDTEGGECLWVMEGHTESVRSACFAPISPLVLTASEDRTARVWNFGEQTLALELKGHTGAVLFAAFSPNEELAITTSFDRTAKLWRVADGSQVRSLAGHHGSITKAAFPVHDASRVLTLCVDAREPVALWSTSEGICKQAFSDGTMVHEASLSPDGSQVLAACADQRVRVWDAESGHCLLELVHDMQVLSAAFSPDGTKLASATGDHTLHVWRLPDGMHERALEGHESKITSIAFLPDNGRLVSTSADGTARVWSLTRGCCDGILAGHSAAIVSSTVSP